MAFDLKEINLRTVADPKGFIEECDEVYEGRVRDAADKIIENSRKSPIVLMSGPSGSGKTTTARKISEELERRGVHAHYVGCLLYTSSDNAAGTWSRLRRRRRTGRGRRAISEHFP